MEGMSEIREDSPNFGIDLEIMHRPKSVHE
jgi:hypothetical protein